MESVLPPNTYYGYKVHVLITLKRSHIASFEITTTSTDTRERLRYLATHWSNSTVLTAESYIRKYETVNARKEYLSFYSETFQ